MALVFRHIFQETLRSVVRGQSHCALHANTYGSRSAHVYIIATRQRFYDSFLDFLSLILFFS